ncbi:MaoC/PaaZ C-terminal domain-containing protein [Halosegnis marinus]|uniref:MaoC/PaaZ C-terminal domain-containing protein n=1 Tax=Halosegnis marinus TaxID=3034023 RepID=A0ABD5ZSI3_9EURY|nr:MaoC/PaaZ C-terminal domain-containing protein [Halosegnis sp. DT85]
MSDDTAPDSYFETVEEGDTSTTSGRTITEADVVNFAGVSGDFNHLHLDDVRMAESSFGQRIAHGMLVLSAATGLLWQNRTQEEREAVVAFYGIDRLRFRAPVFLGERIHVETEVIGTERKPDGPGTGTVRYALEVVKNEDTVAVSCETVSLLE